MCPVNRTSWELKEIPQNMREYFDEFETKCGMAWERVVEKIKGDTKPSCQSYSGDANPNAGSTTHQETLSNKTIGWQPRCKCDAGEPVPCVVWDLFGGSGTVAVVANRLNRNWVLTELSEEYIKLAEKRIGNQVGLKL